nr:RNA polymerase subunit sigma-70 [Oikeobacillus pervagus]
MRANEKSLMSSNGENQIFGVDFHHFIQKEQESNSIELASEFGLSLREVQLLKKKLERS